MPRKDPRKREYHQHGPYPVARQLETDGLPDASTPLGQAVREWRDAIVRDLGGADAISTQPIDTAIFSPEEAVTGADRDRQEQ